MVGIIICISNYDKLKSFMIQSFIEIIVMLNVQDILFLVEFSGAYCFIIVALIICLRGFKGK